MGLAEEYEDREDGINRATARAGEEWINSGVSYIDSLPIGTRFISDLVFEHIPPCPGDARAMAGILRRARSSKLISPVMGELRPSARKGCHANLVQLWERTQNEEKDNG